MTESPIETYLDDLLRRSRADARTTRRLLEEAADHLYATAAELEADGLARPAAEAEALRRFGPAAALARSAAAQSGRALAADLLRAAVFLAGWGLAAIGASGLVVFAMNLLFGRSFVGGFSLLGNHHTVTETADDAVVLRVLAGLVGVALLVGYRVVRPRTARPSLLPAGLVDVLGAAAFAGGAAVLAAVAIDQGVQHGRPGVGFPLSGALVALPAAVYFAVRTGRALLDRPHASPAAQ